MTTTPDIQQITELVRQAAAPVPIPGSSDLFLIAGSDGAQKLVDLRSHTADPRSAKQASRSVRDTRSFLTYLGKHRNEKQTEVYADLEASKIVAIIDAHFGNEDEAGLNQHILSLDLVHTIEWTTWLKSDGVKMSQADFAEFMEANHSDIVGEDGVTLLEVAQDLQGATSVEWESGERLATGEVKLSYKETTSARVGNRQDVAIPAKFRIAIKPYLGSPRYGVGVAFRFKVEGTKITMSYHLDRPHVTLESAFEDMVNEVQTGIPASTIELEPGEADSAKIELEELPGVQPVLFGKPQVGRF